MPNLPVGFRPLKSWPYGGKSHLTRVSRWLLLPVSITESPNTMTAGTVTFGGSFIKAQEGFKSIKIVRLENNSMGEEDSTMIDFGKASYSWVFPFLLYFPKTWFLEDKRKGKKKGLCCYVVCLMQVLSQLIYMQNTEAFSLLFIYISYLSHYCIHKR